MAATFPTMQLSAYRRARTLPRASPASSSFPMETSTRVAASCTASSRSSASRARHATARTSPSPAMAPSA
eukprot:CAMPEP_0180146764 /NCGR_PEP_ID=MMETSP0986-20121125/18760_1 /TAXON_ID=697907 /ORGANISM="non described non described, Strain CCMP2293" /LENGTH=69 /DNA_ID=CAMNT_0022091995 /DNA_START=185 /DNA_END=391 /DNA_ORIENTATION=-